MLIKGTYKEIWQISFPIIVGSFAHSINQIIDAAFLGNYSKISLDAITLAGIFFFNITFIAGGFARGCQVIIARHVGEQREDKIGVAFDNLCLIGVFLSIAMMLFLYYCTDWIVLNAISSKLIQIEANIYIKVLILIVPFAVFSFCFNGFFAGLGKTKIITYATISMAITNIILGYILIFGKFGFDRMGILGAAISTAIADIVMFLVYFFYFINQKYTSKYNAFKFHSLSLKTMKNIINLSMPIVLQNLIGITSWQYFFLSVEKLGEDELAVSGILKTLFIFLGIPVWSISSTSNTMISNLIGQNKIELVLPTLKKIIFFTVSISLGLNLIILLFPSFTIGLFTNDKLLLQTSIAPFYTLMLGLLFFSSAMIMNQGIIGTGNTKIPAIVELLCAILYIGYCYYFIQTKKCELYIAWGCEVVYWLSLLIFTVTYWSSGIWKKYIKTVDN
jgi:putative MATE family efflux protein